MEVFKVEYILTLYEEQELKSESEESDDDNASISSEDGDDELDLDQEVSSEDEEQSESESEDEDDSDDDDGDENLPKLKKRKKNKDDGSESFATAVNAILGSKLKAYDRKDPIFARSKQILKKADDEKLEAKARRELLAEKKRVYDQDRIKDLLPKEDSTARQVIDHEKKLRKIAQRGVVRLFNVVMSTQNRTSNEVNKTKVLGQDQKEKLISEISKEKFFDLVKAAGDN
ncbi:Replicase polyprotein [Wickerhamomyces ciferrii]|uniref:Replicase polyprotein n=1 Tax=Wickerhamomyces ciferrii (strain ATCC 14091 / BCRC 22168 / CBS 111 / JCM 3599 / NBRC 0793 / NRRL Y-1031 F-60-10) TaxID=1206466 RepID=K0KNY5_WICCF|nr:Replicase polyprotein [Wickerhamomyces ciferrii]CCH42813.1 Replicase polyprotein [Wickerhamomyces ciferrii]